MTLVAIPSAQTENFDNIQRDVISNGMIVLTKEMPSKPVVSIYALIKTGSATEGKFLGTGISHFMEHMLFKSTKNRVEGAIAEEIKSLGGTINASTSLDYTMVVIDVPKEFFNRGLDVLSDMLMNAVVSEEEFKKERDVILAEMRMHNDRPQRRLAKLSFKTVYQRHPYKHPIIGYEKLFKNLTREDLLEYYQRHYAPNNTILAVAGGVEHDLVLPQIKEAMKDFQPQPSLSRNLPQEPNQIGQRLAEEEYTTELIRMSLAYQGVSVLDADMYALDILAMALGRGKSSRLFMDVYKKKGLVQLISASNFTPVDKGVFEIVSLLDKAEVDLALGAIRENIEKIKHKGLTKAELDKTKRQVLSQHIFNQETTSGMAYSMAFDEAFVGDYQFSSKYVDRVKAISNEDIKRVAKKYLVNQSLNVSILRPMEEEEKKEKSTESTFPNPIVKIDVANRLEVFNGMKILLREDHTLPLVSIAVVFEGGLRHEKPLLNGISALTSRLLVKGTRKRTAKQIAESAESVGAKLNPFSGRNSFGLQMTVLSQDVDLGVEMLEDFIKNSNFPESEFIREKKQLQTAVKARKDDIFSVTSKELRETLFLTHPYRMEDVGSEETLEQISNKDVADFYAKLCISNNMVLAVFGDFDSEDMLRLLKTKFASLKKKEKIKIEFEEAPIEAKREKTIYLSKEQAMLMIGFHGPTITSKDRYGMEVLTTILGSGLTGRIVNKIREELGQAYSLNVGIMPGVDAGYVYFYVLTTDEHLKKTTDILIQEIEKIKNEEISPEEIVNAKAYLKGTFQMGLQTNSSLALHTSLDELYGMGYDHYLSYGNEIDKISKDDLKALANKYLIVEQGVFINARPKNKNKEK